MYIYVQRSNYIQISVSTYSISPRAGGNVSLPLHTLYRVLQNAYSVQIDAHQIRATKNAKKIKSLFFHPVLNLAFILQIMNIKNNFSAHSGWWLSTHPRSIRPRSRHFHSRYKQRKKAFHVETLKHCSGSRFYFGRWEARHVSLGNEFDSKPVPLSDYLFLFTYQMQYLLMTTCGASALKNAVLICPPPTHARARTHTVMPFFPEKISNTETGRRHKTHKETRRLTFPQSKKNKNDT